METGVIIKHSWRLMSYNPGQIMRIFSWAILLGLFVALGLPVLLGVSIDYAQTDPEPSDRFLWATIAFGFVLFFIQIAAAVNCHRHQIDGEVFGWMPRIHFKPTLKYLAASILLALSVSLPIMLAAGLAGGIGFKLLGLTPDTELGSLFITALPLFGFFTGFVLLGMIWLRLMLHLPAIAGQHEGQKIWAATKGRTWTFFLLALLDGLLFVLPSLFLPLMSPQFFGEVMIDRTFMVFISFAQTIMSNLIMIFTISQLSAMYIRYIGDAGLQRDDVSVFE